MQAGRAAVLGLATVLAATGAATGTAGVLASTPRGMHRVKDAVVATNIDNGSIF